MTAHQLAYDFAMFWGRAVSLQWAIYGRLLADQLSSRRPVTFVPLADFYRRSRLNWTRDRPNSTQQKIGYLLFSDKSRFPKITDLEDPWNLELCIRPATPANCMHVKVVVWHKISVSGLPDFHIFPGNVVYIRPFLAATDAGSVFMHNYAWFHKARIVSQYFVSETRFWIHSCGLTIIIIWL